MNDHDIDGRLRSIETKVGVIAACLESSYDELHRLTVRHEELLYGSSLAPGVDKRVDRLEQSDASRRWTLRAVWGLILAALTGVASLFWQQPPKP